jgi:hypothetical protein
MAFPILGLAGTPDKNRHPDSGARSIVQLRPGGVGAIAIAHYIVERDALKMVQIVQHRQ